MNYYNKLLTKKSLYNVPYRMLLLNYKELSKKRTCFNKICFFKKVLPYLYTARIWLNLNKSKAFRESCVQMFYKIGVFENLAEFTGKRLCWSHSLTKLQV